MNWKEIISIIGFSGLISFIIQKRYEYQLNKQILRYTKLYTDKLDVIRILYQKFILAERALILLMSQREPDKNEEKKVFQEKTNSVIIKFFEYFEENEIIFEQDIVELIHSIKGKFDSCILKQTQANHLESSRPSEAWEKAVCEKQEAFELIVNEDIPILKGHLKRVFQKRYHIIEKNQNEGVFRNIFKPKRSK
jgi:hypothetical protein